MPVHQQRKFALTDDEVGKVLVAARHSVTLDLRTGVPGRVRHRVETPTPTCLLVAKQA